MWLTRLALRYPISTLMGSIAIFVLGLVSFLQLPIDMLPNIQIPAVSVITYYNGAAPSDMEQSVTIPLERAVSSTNNVNYVQSQTREGVDRIYIYFNWDANTNVGLVDVIQKINRAFSLLPTGVSQPIALRFDISNLPVCSIVLSSGMDDRELYDLAYNVIEPQIEHLDGIASAAVTGGKIREIHVVLNRNRIEALNMPLQNVTDAVAQSNLIIPSGDLKTGVFDYSLATESQYNVVQPMENMVVKVINGIPIRIKDIGYVEDSYQEQTEVVRVNGQHGVVLRVLKSPDANTVDVVDEVIDELPRLQGVPPSVRSSLSFDQSQYIRDSISGLQQEALMGALLATIVILLFLRNARSALVIFVAIPLSILVTFIYFRFSATTLNIMTLGGLALGVGRLVDDSIVELENITRHYNLMGGQKISRMQATLDAALEVAGPIFISTLTTVIVFLPVVFLSGVAKLLFLPLVLTITVALFGSFFVSRTVTPLLCYRIVQPEKEIDLNSKKYLVRLRLSLKNLFEDIDINYQKTIGYLLKHKRYVVFSVAGFALLSFGLFKFVGTEFFPDSDESQFSISVKLPVGTRIEETEKYAERVEDILRKNIPEVKAIISDIGMPSQKSGHLFGSNPGTYAAGIQVQLVEPAQRKRSEAEIINAVRPVLMTMPGARIYVTPGGFLHFLLNFGSAAPIDVEIMGYDMATAMRLTQQVYTMVRSTPGAVDVQISQDPNLPQLRVIVDRNKAGALGVNVADVANTVSTAIDGSVASLYQDTRNGNSYNILVRLNESDRNRIDDIRCLTVNSSSGHLVTLGNIANVVMSNSPVEIDRKYQQRIIDVTANVAGRDLGSVSSEIQNKINTLAVPSGFQVIQSGNIEQQNSTFRSLGLALILAIIMVYMVMASQFQSLVDPFIIMFTIPLGVAGVVWALFLTNTTLSVTSFEGVIVMVGIVVSNGILLIDYINRLRKRGMELHEAVMTGGRTRLRPILMTSLATIFGLIPMAIGVGGERSQAPLAIAVIGGLTASTFLTLIFVPTLYTIFEERFKRELTAKEQGRTVSV
ncbi:MAG TPA: efflux RND transporter permease subunit [Candidatus Acidoferrales bacterium]|nr:efflux RND transporter permease subunit [Candidatus Acidoferrales bacterium]